MAALLFSFFFCCWCCFSFYFRTVTDLSLSLFSSLFRHYRPTNSLNGDLMFISTDSFHLVKDYIIETIQSDSKRFDLNMWICVRYSFMCIKCVECLGPYPCSVLSQSASRLYIFTFIINSNISSIQLMFASWNVYFQFRIQTFHIPHTLCTSPITYTLFAIFFICLARYSFHLKSKDFHFNGKI